jgi:hypothetical protein
VSNVPVNATAGKEAEEETRWFALACPHDVLLAEVRTSDDVKPAYLNGYGHTDVYFGKLGEDYPIPVEPGAWSTCQTTRP